MMLLPVLVLMRGGAGTGAGPAAAMTKSKARVFAETDTKTTFANVAGVDEAKEELNEIVAFLKDPTCYGRLGAHVPRGVLLVGPPGTGKTLLARAVAGEAGVPFQSINGSEFVELYVGVGAARVRDLLEQGRQMAPAIIFIDELDALGRARGAASRSAAMKRRSKPSISSFPRSTALTRRSAWYCSRRPIGRKSSIRRCCARGALIARCWSIGRIKLVAFKY